MAVNKKEIKKDVVPKKTPNEVRRENVELKAELEKIKTSYASCRMCGRLRNKSMFHISTDPLMKIGIAPICKDCAYKLALRIGDDGVEQEPTKESVQLALRYLDKPYLENVYEASMSESQNLTLGRTKSNVWTAYAKNIAMVNYVGKTWSDSDIFKGVSQYDERTSTLSYMEHAGMDTYDNFKKNRADVIRLLDYDPFEKESVTDQPLLYSQLLGMLDSSEDANEDMLRTSSAITIVRAFLQQSKIDDTITKLMAEISELQKNASTIKSLQESKGRLTSVIKDLAAESCLSLKNSKTATKGENTWTGKVKKIKDLNLRSGEVNGFDINTCKGMRQVQELSDASIMKQLALDESEWADMVAEMRVANQALRAERDQYKEINRILLRENIDLKDYLSEHDLLDDNLQSLKDLYSPFSGVSEDDEDESDSE